MSARKKGLPGWLSGIPSYHCEDDAGCWEDVGFIRPCGGIDMISLQHFPHQMMNYRLSWRTIGNDHFCIKLLGAIGVIEMN